MASCFSSWKFLLVLSLLASAYGLMVCPPGICETINCAPEATLNCAEDSQAKIVPHAGFCGCCPACVHYLEKGESCASLLLLRPSVPAVQCLPGLMCHPSKLICIPADGS